MRDVLGLKRPSLREIFSRFVPLRGIFIENSGRCQYRNISNVNIEILNVNISTHQHLTTSTSPTYFTTNFLFFVMYTPGFSPSSDSPLERTFLPVRS